MDMDANINDEKRTSHDTDVKNKNLIQSLIFTKARYDFSVYEKRILYRLIEVAQANIEGHTFKDGGCRKIEPDLLNNQVFTFASSAFLKDEKDENYTRIKAALQSLRRKDISYEDDDDWVSIGIIEAPHINKRSRTVDFRVDARIWNCILDFSAGFRKYNMKIAWSFKSAFSMRLYELVSGQKLTRDLCEKYLTFTIEELKAMLGLSNKYSRTNDFIKRVIEPAKKELDEFAPYTFTYELKKEKVEGKTTKKITFYPIHQLSKEDPDLEKKEIQRKTSLRWDLDKRVLDYLKNVMGWKENSIKNNRDLLVMAQNSIPDFLNILAELHGKSRDLKNPAGYVVNALRGKLNDMMANNR